MLYFAYGSNMSSARLKARVPSADAKTIGHITGHILLFNKVSQDNLGNRSGKGHIHYTGNPADIVYGVVYEFNDAKKEDLDIAEGLGKGYAEKTVTVKTSEGEIEAVTYYATKTDDSLKPYGWYLAHVITGAKEHHLHGEYVKKLEELETIPDPNPEGHDC